MTKHKSNTLGGLFEDFGFTSDTFKAFDNIVEKLNYGHIFDYPEDQYILGGSLNIEIPLAGYKSSDIDIAVEGFDLVLNVAQTADIPDRHYVKKGIRKKALTRKWQIHEVLDVDKITSKFVDGLLTITIPAKEEVVKEPQRKKVVVQ